mgnify:CR=1 FL=1
MKTKKIILTPIGEIEVLSLPLIGEIGILSTEQGKELLKWLTVSRLGFLFFSPLTKIEAYSLINRFKTDDQGYSDLSYPFSGDCAGGTGDCIITLEKNVIKTIGVSVRQRVRVSDYNNDKISSYGHSGKVFIKSNHKT